MKNYFPGEELECKCCGKLVFDEEFRSRLNVARQLAGVPFVITSGYRCKRHNRNIGGVDTSSHLLGLAVDISTPNSFVRFAVLRNLILEGFTRIGIRKDFIHVDMDDSKTKEVSWVY